MPTTVLGRGSSDRDRSHTLRDWAHLYEAADQLTARCQTGEAAAVLEEIGGLLAEAEAADVAEVLNRLRYVVALANLHLGDLDRAVEACDQMIAQGGDGGDPAWASSAHALRGIARSERGDQLSAVDDLVDAAVLLDDARPTGQPYVYAADGIGLGYLDLRLYELALDTYELATPLVTRPGLNLPRMFHLFHHMLVEVSWGLELERLEEPDAARAHFGAALALADGAEPLPTTGTHAWTLRFRALVGLCHAMIGATDLAINSLESTAEALAEGELDEEAMARMGLARAYGQVGDLQRAHAEADRAEHLVDGHDRQLGLSIAWERQRLAQAAGPSPAAAVVSEYASRLEHERWDDRVRFAAETRGRLRSEIELRAARKMSAEYLTDPQTGAANRRHLELRLPEMVSRAQTHEETVALAFVDLDSDTTLEDLVSIGASLRTSAGPDGFVARYGGSEFVVVLPRQTARQLADVVDSVIGSRRVDGAARPRVGVASAVRPPSVAGLMAAADEALLAARRAGGGIRLAVSTPE